MAIFARHGVYRSAFEAKFAKFLTSKGIKFEYENEKIPYKVRVYGHSCNDCSSTFIYVHRTYVTDFTVEDSTGRKYYIETKGKFTPKDRKKFVALKASGVDVIIVFQRNNKLSKESHVTYTKWCDKENIECYIANLPTEVINKLKE